LSEEERRAKKQEYTIFEYQTKWDETDIEKKTKETIEHPWVPPPRREVETKSIRRGATPEIRQRTRTPEVDSVAAATATSTSTAELELTDEEIMRQIEEEDRKKREERRKLTDKELDEQLLRELEEEDRKKKQPANSKQIRTTFDEETPEQRAAREAEEELGREVR